MVPLGVLPFADHLAQNIGQDAAVGVVFNFDIRVEAGGDREGDLTAVGFEGANLELLTGLDIFDTADKKGFRAIEPEAFGTVARHEHQRQHAHTHQVAAVDPFKRPGDNGFDPQQVGSFGRPVPGGAGTVLLAPQHHQRRFLTGVDR